MPENHGNTHWTEQEMTRLQRLLDQGLSVTICAVRLQCHRSKISRHIRKLEDSGRRAAAPGRRPPPTGLTDAKLLKMMQDNPGMTRSELATALGVTKNVIAGRVYRLQGRGILKRNPAHEPKRKRVNPELLARARAAKRAAASAMAVARQADQAKARSQGRKPREERPYTVGTGGMVNQLLALRSNQCRYIMGDTTDPDCSYCEAEKEAGSSYCLEHKQRCMHAAPGRSVYPARR